MRLRSLIAAIIIMAHGFILAGPAAAQFYCTPPPYGPHCIPGHFEMITCPICCPPPCPTADVAKIAKQAKDLKRKVAKHTETIRFLTNSMRTLQGIGNGSSSNSRALKDIPSQVMGKADGLSSIASDVESESSGGGSYDPEASSNQSVRDLWKEQTDDMTMQEVQQLVSDRRQAIREQVIEINAVAQSYVALISDISKEIEAASQFQTTSLDEDWKMNAHVKSLEAQLGKSYAELNSIKVLLNSIEKRLDEDFVE
jgi:hypothetical protein